MSASMESSAVRPSQPVALIDALHALRVAPRGADFYDQYCALAQALCGADCAVVVSCSDTSATALGRSGPETDQTLLLEAMTPERWSALADKGYSHDTLRKADGLGLVLIMVRLLDVQPSALMLALPERQRAHLKEALVRAMLLRDLRAQPSGASSLSSAVALADGAGGSQQGLLQALSLATEVMQAPRFGAAALSLVNGLIRLYGLRQATLCWRRAGHTEVVAISHLERFEKTSRLVQAMEAAANEVLAVDRVLSVDAVTVDESQALAPPAHVALLHSLEGVQAIDSLPVRDSSGQTQAVVLCASEGKGLPPQALNDLLLMLELVLPQLTEST